MAVIVEAARVLKMLRDEFEHDVADVATGLHPPASLLPDRYTRDALLSDATMTCLDAELHWEAW